jgi:hypothetical protein
VGLGIVRKWIDGVDMIADEELGGHACVSQLVKAKNKALTVCRHGRSREAQQKVQFNYDAWELGHPLEPVIVQQS